MSTMISREALYKMVWETPVDALAKRFGISGNGLVKICHRHGVPRPPRGYWAKLAAGKTAVATPLPKATGNAISQISIIPTRQLDKNEIIPPELQQTISHIVDDIDIAVPPILTKPHKIIAAWLATHEKMRKKPRSSPFDEGYGFAEWTEIDNRRHRILDTIFKGAAACNLKVMLDGKLPYFKFREERIDFRLREKTQKTTGRSGNEGTSGSGYRKSREPTGKLLFSITTYLGDHPVRKAWLDSEINPIEAHVREIIKNLVLAGHALESLRFERAREKERWAEEQIIRQEIRRQNEIEDKRWQYFLTESENWIHLNAARNFLAALKKQEFDPNQVVSGQTIGEWISHFELQINECDPLRNTIKDLIEKIVTVRIP